MPDIEFYQKKHHFIPSLWISHFTYKIKSKIRNKIPGFRWKQNFVLSSTLLHFVGFAIHLYVRNNMLVSLWCIFQIAINLIYLFLTTSRHPWYGELLFDDLGAVAAELLAIARGGRAVRVPGEPLQLNASRTGKGVREDKIRSEKKLHIFKQKASTR